MVNTSFYFSRFPVPVNQEKVPVLYVNGPLEHTQWYKAVIVKDLHYMHTALVLCQYLKQSRKIFTRVGYGQGRHGWGAMTLPAWGSLGGHITIYLRHCFVAPLGYYFCRAIGICLGGGAGKSPALI